MTMRKKALLVLGGESEIQSRHLYDQARAQGLRVVLTDTPKRLEQAIQLHDLADEVHPLDFEDVSGCLRWVGKYPRRELLAGAFSFKEKAQPAIAALVRRFGFNGPSERAHECTTNKLVCRDTLRAAGFAQPEARLCRSGEAIDQAFAELSRRHRKLILKPMIGYGSENVFLVDSATALATALAQLRPASERPFLLESFVEGREFSAEGLCVRGLPRVLSLTQKFVIGGGNFVECGHVAPADLPPALCERAITVVQSAVHSVGLTFGMFHAEFWACDAGEIVMGEIHSRPGGDYITHLTQHVTGIAYYGSVFAQMLCADAGVVMLPAAHCGAAGIRYFVPPAGRVTEITGYDRLPEMPGYAGAALLIKVGDTVKPVRHSFDRVGHVLATGASATEVKDRLERMIMAVAITVQ
ncbi:ATP-grasp domain-containing protein [Bradyrhizobium sp. 160]|uniref:ATP-grasp domain-containing protein n=1 Tax=Bradyrhizobium sp. 160 TaxID=2782634 RepID=UPI001FF94048|nr:ATP-grasp domain-containing protein [Bradyrhizobium sp. 160]MCK1627069.1 ATP-grasp domain-containing protein [Bradyrhizobium sp. 160]